MSESGRLQDCELNLFQGQVGSSGPKGEGIITIDLDGTLRSNLDWKRAQEQAQAAVKKGSCVMWKMDMGLFNRLAYPLTHQGQFLSLTLALEHFRDSLWKEFASETVGLSLFQGSADFTHNFRWDDHEKENWRHWLQEIGDSRFASLNLIEISDHEEGAQLLRLYCRDVCMEYFTLLAASLPDALPLYLYLDAASFSSLSLVSSMQLFNPERFDRFHLSLKGAQLPFDASDGELSIGICVPPMHFYQASHYEGLEKGLKVLKQKSIPFKLIAESYLTAQWEGLDDLLYSPKGLSPQGKRKLQGFCAAGGRVISSGPLLGFSYELTLEQWLPHI